MQLQIKIHGRTVITITVSFIRKRNIFVLKKKFLSKFRHQLSSFITTLCAGGGNCKYMQLVDLQISCVRT